MDHEKKSGAFNSLMRKIGTCEIDQWKMLCCNSFFILRCFFYFKPLNLMWNSCSCTHVFYAFFFFLLHFRKKWWWKKEIEITLKTSFSLRHGNLIIDLNERKKHIKQYISADEYKFNRTWNLKIEIWLIKVE